jgi:hypothetical protein
MKAVILQRKAAPATDRPVGGVTKSSGRPLDEDTRAFMESRFHYDFGRVRVRSDSEASRSAWAVNARAYTIGRHVVFGAGRYAPGTPQGERLLAHELTHVAQQQNGVAGASPEAERETSGNERRLHSSQMLSLHAPATPFARSATSTGQEDEDPDVIAYKRLQEGKWVPVLKGTAPGKKVPTGGDSFTTRPGRTPAEEQAFKQYELEQKLLKLRLRAQLAARQLVESISQPSDLEKFLQHAGIPTRPPKDHPDLLDSFLSGVPILKEAVDVGKEVLTTARDAGDLLDAVAAGDVEERRDAAR